MAIGAVGQPFATNKVRSLYLHGRHQGHGVDQLERLHPVPHLWDLTEYLPACLVVEIRVATRKSIDSKQDRANFYIPSTDWCPHPRPVLPGLAG